MANSEITNLLSDLDTLILDTNNCINDFTSALGALSEAAIRYIHQYDEYVYETHYDAAYLKARMKDTIMKAVSDELH